MTELIVDYLNEFFLFYFFIYAIIFFASTLFSMLALNKYLIRKRYNTLLEIESIKNYIPISILIPAYNESETIVDCIESNLALDYPHYEIIIINDGSTDDTEKVILEHFKLKEVPRPVRRVIECKSEHTVYERMIGSIKLTLITKENGGKADALNLGINFSAYPLFISLDADSILKRDALSEIIIPFFEDGNTVAVGGNISAANSLVIHRGEIIKKYKTRKLLLIYQLIEYYRVFLTTRIWFNDFNANLIISGAFGLFKKDAVIRVGGYNTNSIGEDMDLVMKLHSFYLKHDLPYNIQYAHNAICWTQMPSRLRDLKSQRRRWHMGLITCMLEHRYMFLNPKYKIIGLFSYLYYAMFEMLSCIFDLVGLVIILISYFLGYINTTFFITFMLVYISYSMIVSICAVYLSRYVEEEKMTFFEMIKLMFFAILESLGYRQLMSWYRLTAFFGYRKQKTQWNKMKRTRHNKAKVEDIVEKSEVDAKKKPR